MHARTNTFSRDWGTPASIFQSSDQGDGRGYRRDGEGVGEKQQQLRFGKGTVPLS